MFKIKLDGIKLKNENEVENRTVETENVCGGRRRIFEFVFNYNVFSFANYGQIFSRIMEQKILSIIELMLLNYYFSSMYKLFDGPATYKYFDKLILK